jgi:hypothetical protein
MTTRMKMVTKVRLPVPKAAQTIIGNDDPSELDTPSCIPLGGELLMPSGQLYRRET